MTVPLKNQAENGNEEDNELRSSEPLRSLASQSESYATTALFEKWLQNAFLVSLCYICMNYKNTFCVLHTNFLLFRLLRHKSFSNFCAIIATWFSGFTIQRLLPLFLACYVDD